MTNFAGYRVLSLESRRAEIMKTQIEKFGGYVLSAPSLKEVPLSENAEAFDFGQKLTTGTIDAVIFMTGVGANFLLEALRSKYELHDIIAWLNKTFVIARGPKPVKVLNEHQIKIDIKVPEPNTWKEVLTAMEASAFQCAGKTIAIQEYGTPNDQLIEALLVRGVTVVNVPVYRWALPDDISMLKKAVDAVIHHEIDIVMVTSGIQLQHLVEVAAQENREKQLLNALGRIVISSIGPVTNETIEAFGLKVDFNPTHAKMGTLIAETAAHAAELMNKKRSSH